MTHDDRIEEALIGKTHCSTVNWQKDLSTLEIPSRMMCKLLSFEFRQTSRSITVQSRAYMTSGRRRKRKILRMHWGEPGQEGSHLEALERSSDASLTLP